MLCQRCQQRPATVFFSQTVGNQTTQAHLCEVCAQEQSQAYGLNTAFFNPFSAISDFLNNFMNWGEGQITEVNSGRAGSVAVDPQAQCPHCGYQLSTFRQNGRLGCTQCYDAFKNVLDPLVSSIHGNVRHVEESENVEKSDSGKVASPATGNSTVKELREKMKTAIENEKFEEAARLRDEIKKLEGK